MQVVTNENMAEFIQNRSVPDFVPPKADAKVDSPNPVKTGSETGEVWTDPAQQGKSEPARGADGKFVKADEVAAEAAVKAEKSADEDDPDGEGLTEHARRVIGKKHRRMKEAEEFARQLYGDKTAAEKRAEEAERKLAEQTKSRPDSDKDSKEPKAEDFKTVGEYAEALAEYKVEKKFAARDAQQLQEAQERAAAKAQHEFNKRIEATMKELPDYADVIEGGDIDVPPHMTVYIADSPVGPQIGYWLIKNPDEVDRIKSLSPIRAVAELGKLEDRKPWAKKPEAAKPDGEAAPVVSRAPSPITPLEGKSASAQKDPAKMTIPELREYELAQRLAKSRR